MHVDGGREEVGARRGAVEGWPGCMGEGGGVGGGLKCVRYSWLGENGRPPDS